MKLEQYLQGLRECPDERVRLHSGEEVHRLSADYGICYEFPILLKSEIKRVVEFLSRKGFKVEDLKNDLFRFNSEEGLTILARYKHFKYLTTADRKTYFNISDEEELHHTKQNRDYDLLVRLSGDEEDPNKEIIIGNEVIQIGRFAIANNLPLCLPKSTGLRNPEGYSQIVYFPDSDDDEIQRLIQEVRKKK